MKLRDIKLFVDKNGAGIATVTSIVLAVAGVVSAIRKSRETAKILDKYETEYPTEGMDATEKIKTKISEGVEIVVANKEAVVCTAGSCACAWWANRKNGQKISTLLAALALNEDKLSKIYAKAEKVFGKQAGKDLREAVDCDIPPFDLEDPVKSKNHAKKNEDVELYYESWTRTPYEDTPRNFENALALAQKRIQNSRGSLDFDKWLSFLGLDSVPAASGSGWCKEFPFKPYTEMVEIDGVEYIGIFYENIPRHDYVNHLWPSHRS